MARPCEGQTLQPWVGSGPPLSCLPAPLPYLCRAVTVPCPAAGGAGGGERPTAAVWANAAPWERCGSVSVWGLRSSSCPWPSHSAVGLAGGCRDGVE